jgi:hypothetical protein
LKHYQNILNDNGFVLSEEGEMKKLDKNDEKKMKQLMESIDDKLFDEYLEDEIKQQPKYCKLKSNIDFLGLTTDDQIKQYKSIITDRFKLADHLNIIRLFKSDEYINEKIIKISKECYDVKAYDNVYNKIKMLRLLEKKSKIESLNVDFEGDDTSVEINNDDYILI